MEIVLLGLKVSEYCFGSEVELSLRLALFGSEVLLVRCGILEGFGLSAFDGTVLCEGKGSFVPNRHRRESTNPSELVQVSRMKIH